METSIAVPNTPEQITAEWFTSVTGIQIPNPSSFKVESDACYGIGFLSNMVRVEFQTNDLDKQLRKFIIKILPSEEKCMFPGLLDFIISEAIHEKEIFFYETLKQLLVSIVPELDSYLLHAHYAGLNKDKSKEYGAALIFTDLSNDGYKMPSFELGLSPAQFEKGLQFAAKFHFAGTRLPIQEGKKSILEAYPLLNDWYYSACKIEDHKSLGWFAQGIQLITKELDSIQPPLEQKSKEKMKRELTQLEPLIYKIIKLLSIEGQKYPTVIHNDLWPHNFLVKESNLQVIDWQLVVYSDSVYDLGTYILTCLPIEDINETKITAALWKYHEFYNETVTNHYHEEQVPESKKSRNWYLLQKAFNTYGLAYALVWFALSADSIYSKPEYRPKLFRIFEYFCEQNVNIPNFLIENI